MSIATLLRKALVTLLLCVFILPAFGQRMEFSYPDAWGNDGFNLKRQDQTGVKVIHSITKLALYEEDVDGTPMKMVEMPGISLPNNEGSPNLPGNGRYIAIPQGAAASLRINSVRKEIVENIDFLPASQIPLANDDSPLRHVKDMNIYGKNEFYPADPFQLSEPTTLRGVDVVMLGITPFQYNPVTKQLIVYHDVDLEVEFTGGNGYFGDDRLRSRWWDPILEDALLNYNMLPQIDYAARQKELAGQRVDGFEYIIIVPDDLSFIAWADSIRKFRTRQGISTKVVTTTEIGGNNVTLIKNYISSAYTTWNPAPAAVLLIGDYGTTGATLISQYYTNHPGGSSMSYISDHFYSDMTGNHMPDVILARITARTPAELQKMIGKALNYERNPPTNANFYNKPMTAMGWQTERWFQLCAETVNGFWQYQLGKQPLRQNNIYSGTPGTTWSSATNTATVVNYFGPNGLNYIPATPAHLNSFGWSANATSINNAINSGAFMVLHRDHGLETGWGEPLYRNNNLPGLNNDDLTYVLSINCLTGKFNHSSECFTEAFHRLQKGAVGLLAASETSYSFVNDAYVWGVMDNMWPNFMPAYGTNPASRGVLPAFSNAAGKIFLQQSSWPSNPQHKQITHYLFHHHGDAFTSVYTEMPQNLTITHAATLPANQGYFEVTANTGALVALTVNNALIGAGTGTGGLLSIPIPAQPAGTEILVTATLQNHYRYEALVTVGGGAGVPGDANCDGNVNVLDAITIVNYVVGTNPQPFCFDNADVNNDGMVNVLDVIATITIILSK